MLPGLLLLPLVLICIINQTLVYNASLISRVKLTTNVITIYLVMQISFETSQVDTK